MYHFLHQQRFLPFAMKMKQYHTTSKWLDYLITLILYNGSKKCSISNSQDHAKTGAEIQDPIDKIASKY